MAWYPILGWGVFWVGLIASIVLYIIKRKAYQVAYLIAICLYVFTFGFVADVFDLSKNWILMLLALSAIMMMLVGKYLSGKI